VPPKDEKGPEHAPSKQPYMHAHPASVDPVSAGSELSLGGASCASSAASEDPLSLAGLLSPACSPPASGMGALESLPLPPSTPSEGLG
jgi:hypothetical protein